MKSFVEITPSAAIDAIDLIGKEWMLIGGSDGSKTNAMTASWGTLGTLWNKPVCVCFIRPQRFTFELAEKEDRLSFSFFGKEKRDALALCGKESGRSFDKLAKAGLTYQLSDGVPIFDDARLTLIGKKLYTDYLKEENFLCTELLKHYPENDYHKIYVCEIERCLIKK